MFILNCNRAYFFAHPEHELTADEEARYDAALVERSRGVPAQYITGHQEFWGMDLIVTPAVLIPRPETEHVIETVLDRVKWATAPPNALRIADVGTGSGPALEVARANAARHQLETRIRFIENDLLNGFENSSFDFIVSNPPYVGEAEEDEVQLEVRKFEPRNAVFGGPTGTEVIARLLPQAHAALKPGGCLVMEVSGTIAEAVKRLLEGWEEIRTVNDLQGISRVVAARKPL